MVSAVFGVATVVEFVVEGFTYFYDNFFNFATDILTEV
jgi:hypothetical protein